MKKYLFSRAGCSFTSVLGFCNRTVTREHLRIKKQIATHLWDLQDLPAACYTGTTTLVSDEDWKLPSCVHAMLLSAETLPGRCVIPAKHGPTHLIKVWYFCSCLSSDFNSAYTTELLQFLLKQWSHLCTSRSPSLPLIYIYLENTKSFKWKETGKIWLITTDFQSASHYL